MVVALAPFTAAFADDVATARSHYERGTTLYDLQRYDEAAKEYEAAYEAKHDPALLFNIGQAYRLAGDFKKAIGAYRSFLRRVPNTDNRGEIEARIAEMQKQLDEQRKTQEKPPTEPQSPTELKSAPTPTPTAPPTEEPKPAPPSKPTATTTTPAAASRAERPGRIKLIVGIAVAAVGVAALAAGIGVEVAAQNAFAEINSPSPGYTFDAGTESFYKAGEPAGYVLIGVGAAAAIAGVTVAVLGIRDQRAHRLAVAPVVIPAYAGASLRFDF